MSKDYLLQQVVFLDCFFLDCFFLVSLLSLSFELTLKIHEI